MDIDEDLALEHDVEFRPLESPEQDTADRDNLECDARELYARKEGVGSQEPLRIRDDEGLFVPDEPLVVGNDGEIAEPTDTLQLPSPRDQLTVSDEYSDPSKLQPDQAPISRRSARKGGGGGKWVKRKRKNPFISFFLSMYSRRPRQRVAEVARQAGRQWGRMSDSQRKLYADLQQSP